MKNSKLPLRLMSLIVLIFIAFFSMTDRSEVRSGPPVKTTASRQAEAPETPAALTKHKSNAHHASANIAPGNRIMPQDGQLIATSAPVGKDLIESVVGISDTGKKVRRRIIHSDFFYPMLEVEESIDEKPTDKKNQRRIGHVADHLIVNIKKGLTKADVQTMADELGMTVRQQMESLPYCLLSFPVRDFASLDQARNLLETRNEVVRIELDSLIHVDAIPNDPSFGDLWGMNKIQAPSAWNLTTGSRAVTVAVIDSGIDYNHPDLAANIWSNPGETGLDAQGRDKRTNGVDDDGNGKIDDWRGWNFISGNNDPMDDFRHGTHCAGTIGAVGNNSTGVTGVCWQVSLVPIKIADSSGNGTTFMLGDGMKYAANMGCDIASISIGGNYSNYLQTVLEYTKTKGLLCVASAGNNNVNTDVTPQSPGSNIIDNLISVMNTGTTDVKSGTSNYGLTTVALAAPGENILSTVPSGGYSSETGTSMSTPHVAGACALLKSIKPSLTAIEIRQAILSGVDVLPSLSGMCITGGRLNVYKSVIAVTGSIPSYVSSAFTEAVSSDGNVNPGEDAVGTITLSNYTMGPVTGMVGHLSTSDPDVTVINGTLNYGTLNAGQSTSGAGQFRVRLSAGSTPRFVALTLTVTSDTGGSWTFPVGYSCVNSAIFGYVRSRTGSAIAGATVSWSGTESGQVASRADGFYAIPAVDGSYSVTASATGFVSSSPVPLTVPPYLRQDFALDFADLTVTPDTLSMQATIGQSASTPMTLTNTGSLPVTWSIPTSGYRFMTSDKPGGPAYVWNDIAATGTLVTGLTDDTNLGPFSLGFSMPFYGLNFTGIRVCSNGWLSFTNTTTTFKSTVTLPNSTLPENLIAPLLRDLKLTTAGTVHYKQIDGDTFVVQFTNVPRFTPSTSLCTFQVVLKRDGTILFYYLRVDDPTVGLVGIQNAAKNEGLTLAYNQDFLKPGLAVRIQTKPAWLSMTPTSGTLAPGAATSVTMTGNSTGLGVGTYQTTVFVNSNDADSPLQTRQMSFNVVTNQPTITTWPTASAIVYGQALSASSLTGGSATVPGTFTFGAPATTPSAGAYSAAVTFTPTDTANYSPVSGSVTVQVAKVTPAVTAWPTASTIVVGQALSASSLTGGSASTSGSFAFLNPSTTPPQGTYSAEVRFTPADTANYHTVDGTVNVVVQKPIPSITVWPVASAIVYGQALSASSLTGGSASVSGTFAFDAPATTPNAGTYSAAVTFTPTDTANFSPVSNSVAVEVAKATPVITAWPTASAIAYGNYLSASTLSGGSASVAGTFAFNDPEIQFNGQDAFTFRVSDGEYTSAPATVSITTGAPVAAPASLPFVPNASHPWTPTDMTTLAWYDAADNSTITPSSGPVSQWNDKSGNARHVAQSLATQQPNYASNTIRFDGTNDYLMQGAAFMYAAGSTDVYVVASVAATADKRLISENSSTADSSLYNLAQTHSGTGSIMSSFIRADDGSLLFSNATQLSGSGAVSISTPKLYLWRDSGTRMSARVSGGSETGANYSRSKTLTLNRFTLGGIGPRPSSSTGSGFINAGVNEVVITSNLSDEARQKMEGYLAWKWNLQANLPIGHPYQLAAPVVITNSAPIAYAQSVAVELGTPKAITLTGSDPDGDALSYIILTQPTYGTLSGTPPNVTYTPPTLPAAGTHNMTVTFTPTDTANYHSVTGTVSVTVNPATTPYAQWTTQYPGHDLSNPNGDSDGDGLTNFHEFAFGLNPTNGNSTNPIMTPLDKANHSFSYTRRAGSGLTYTVCISTDLDGWQDLLPTQVTENVSVNAATGVETVGVTILPTSLPDTNNLFLRVKAN